MRRAVRLLGRVARPVVFAVAAYMLMATPERASAQFCPNGCGVCRNGVGCIGDYFSCDDAVLCFLSALEAALYLGALAALVGLVGVVAAPVVVAEAAGEAAAALAAEGTVEAVAVEATVTAAATDATVTAAAAEGTVATAAAGTVTAAAAEGTVTAAAAEATVTTEAVAGEAATEATTEATTELTTPLSGHGEWPYQNGFNVVPDGTYVEMYSGEGQTLANSVGQVLDVGGQPAGGPVQVFGPGDLYPDYQLLPPVNPPISIAGTPNVIGPGMSPIPGMPNIVSAPTNLSDILQPGMGRVIWAACRVWTG